ncbi:hypothetical protein MMC11_002791, partial [Xylographa trunciseda]|nr:hypothetical protein [Xylographa trunciseda]
MRSPTISVVMLALVANVFQASALSAPQKPLETLPTTSTTTRSSTERVFLASCSGYPGQGAGYVVSSEMDYYATDAASRTGAQPDARVVISQGSYTTWEGNTISGTFPDGNTFVSQIAAGAQNLPDFEYAGSGYNNQINFTCYKDDGRALWSWGAGGFGYGCVSVYYCED